MPKCLNQVVDENTLFYANSQDGFLLKIHETPTLTIYSRLIQILLINFLKNKVKEEYSFSRKHAKNKNHDYGS